MNCREWFYGRNMDMSERRLVPAYTIHHRGGTTRTPCREVAINAARRWDRNGDGPNRVIDPLGKQVYPALQEAP